MNEDSEHAALVFGSSIHKALEHWYSLPADERELPASQKERAELMAYGHNLESVATGALESIRQFVLRGQSALSQLPENDKRTLSSGIKILMAYFKHFLQDGYEVARDEHGPMIERSFEFLMYDSPELEIRYFGTIDLILKQSRVGNYVVADHKTTAALGSEFYNRCKPNPQYTGYVLGARRCLGINTNHFLVNGIQVAKTKQEFARQVTDRSEEDFAELTNSVHEAVTRWMRAAQFGYPMHSPNPCSMYGGCKYLELCQVPSKLRERIMEFKYPQAFAAIKDAPALVLPTER